MRSAQRAIAKERISGLESQVEGGVCLFKSLTWKLKFHGREWIVVMIGISY